MIIGHERNGQPFDVVQVKRGLMALSGENAAMWMTEELARILVRDHPDCAVELIHELVLNLVDAEDRLARLKAKMAKTAP